MDPELYTRLPWWKKAFVSLDEAIGRNCGYEGPTAPPEGLVGQIWLNAALSDEGSTPAERALKFAQCQKSIQGSGNVECVTTSAVIVRNIVKDQIITRWGLQKNKDDLRVEEFAGKSNRAGLPGWKYRLPSNLPIVGGFMHPTLQLPNVLDQMAEDLKARYDHTFSHAYTSNNQPGNLIDNLRNNHPTIIHGVWEGNFVDPDNGTYEFNIAFLLGGIPHTMPLVMFDATADRWWFYDLGWEKGKPGDGFWKMSTAELMKFWGRHYIFNTYTKPFAMTTITV